MRPTRGKIRLTNSFDMGTHVKKLFVLGVLVCGVTLAFAQNPGGNASTPTTSVSRTTKAVHYRPSGSVKTTFQATELLPGSSGEAKVEAKKTNVTVDAKFQGMD